MRTPKPNSTLIPSPDADIDALMEFALTYGGCVEAGSFEVRAEIASARRNETLDDTCLRPCPPRSERSSQSSALRCGYLRSLAPAPRC